MLVRAPGATRLNTRVRIPEGKNQRGNGLLAGRSSAETTQGIGGRGAQIEVAIGQGAKNLGYRG